MQIDHDAYFTCMNIGHSHKDRTMKEQTLTTDPTVGLLKSGEHEEVRRPERGPAAAALPALEEAYWLCAPAAPSLALAPKRRSKELGPSEAPALSHIVSAALRSDEFE